ncbi:conserved hypothetical protein [Neospora caninum Liverpool]|uniref:Uncharacterized protein n=1 Tax=Neospora caninum (strain Liverpool) TaxID=572307 RepID=F0VCB0_NEOCL|nr:conserved hypothetical protein [Neospora caninum Liverpool]CBZ51244.1 conserved hypothetical protein [Neospora caninum Liverpool]CEL68559.1 TPA: hypothetical protein BN1204_043120 [Neospora caninum Liverpool]|eukprot:XP_003881277.1 conserved hypothetical protein [Neospora caninum Liverpool]
MEDDEQEPPALSDDMAVASEASSPRSRDAFRGSLSMAMLCGDDEALPESPTPSSSYSSPSSPSVASSCAEDHESSLVSPSPSGPELEGRSDPPLSSLERKSESGHSTAASSSSSSHPTLAPTVSAPGTQQPAPPPPPLSPPRQPLSPVASPASRVPPSPTDQSSPSHSPPSRHLQYLFPFSEKQSESYNLSSSLSSPSNSLSSSASASLSSSSASPLAAHPFFPFRDQLQEKAADSQFLSSAGSLLWRFGKKIGTSGKAAAEAAAHAAARAALVTVGEPTILAPPVSPGEERRGSANAGENDGGRVRVSEGQRAGKEEREEKREEEGRETGGLSRRCRREEGEERNEEGVPDDAGGGEHGRGREEGKTPYKRQREGPSEEELKPEIEARRQPLQAHHEGFAQRSCLPSYPPNADTNPSSSAASPPSCEAWTSPVAARHVSAMDGDTPEGDDDGIPRKEVDKEIRRLQEEIVEALCAAAAPAAATAALTATEAAVRSLETSSARNAASGRERCAREWRADAGAVAAATAVALYEDDALLSNVRSLVDTMAALRGSLRRTSRGGKSSLRAAESPAGDESGGAEAGQAESEEESNARQRPTASSAASRAPSEPSACGRCGRCAGRDSGASPVGSAPGETARLLEKIQTQQFELDRLRDTNDRQGKQLLQLTLQLTSLKTEAEERSLHEKERAEQEQARERQERERERERMHAEERQAELSAQHQRELEELAAAAAESFDLKCHLQDLAKTCSLAQDRQRALEEEIAGLRKDLADRDAKLEGLTQLPSTSLSSAEAAAADEAGQARPEDEKREAISSCSVEGDESQRKGRAPDAGARAPTVSVAVQATPAGEGYRAGFDGGVHAGKDERQSRRQSPTSRLPDAREGQGDRQACGARGGERAENTEREPPANVDSQPAKVADQASSLGAEESAVSGEAGHAEALSRKVAMLQFELESVKARDTCERRRQQQQIQDLKLLCIKEKTKREKAEAECQRLMAAALEQQLLELQQRQQSLGDDGFPEAAPRNRLGSPPSSLRRHSAAPQSGGAQEPGAKEAGTTQQSCRRLEHVPGGDRPVGAPAKEGVGRVEETHVDAMKGQKDRDGAEAFPASAHASQAALRELHDAYESLKEEFSQLSVAQTLLQNDVARKAEIIAFLVKKYALNEEAFRGPLPAASSFGWKKLAAAAAEAVGGTAGHSSLSLDEMQKVVEETLLENIRLRTDLATLAEDFGRLLKAQRAEQDVAVPVLSSSAHSSSSADQMLRNGDSHSPPSQQNSTPRASSATKRDPSEVTMLANGARRNFSGETRPQQDERGEPDRRTGAQAGEGASSVSPEEGRGPLSERTPSADRDVKETRAPEEKEKKTVFLSSRCTRLPGHAPQPEKGGTYGKGEDKRGDESCSPLSDFEASSEVILFRADA